MRNKLKTAIIAVGVIGLLSVIPLLGYGFFFWAIAGGILASYLYIKKSPSPVPLTEGLLLGAISGIVASLIYLFVTIPIAYFTLSQKQAIKLGLFDPPESEWDRNWPGVFLVSFMIVVVIFIFSSVGGILGIPLFEKRKANSMAPSSSPDAGV